MKKITARNQLKLFVIRYVAANYNKLNEFNKEVDVNIIRDIKKDPTTLDWILGEVLDNHDFLDLGIIEYSGWNEDNDNIHEVVYNINGVLIRTRQLCGKATFPPREYEYVICVKVFVPKIKYQTI